MDKRIRFGLIFVAVLIFLIVGPYLYLYSQGIRVDLIKWKLVKTGGFDIQVLSPQGAEVSINGKIKKASGFLSDTIFVKNLLPKNYKIEIKKSGYLAWQKTLPVQEGFVTKVQNLMLFKESPNFETVMQNSENFWTAENQKTILLQTKENQEWGFWILDAENEKPPIQIFKQNASTTNSQSPILAAWNDDAKKAIFRNNLQKTSDLYLINYQNPQQAQIQTTSIPANIEKLGILTQDESRFAYLQDSALYYSDLFSKNPTRKLISTSTLGFYVSGNTIFLLEENGILSASQYPDYKKEAINKIPLDIKTSKNYEFKIYNGDSLLFYETQNLYYLSIQSQEFIKLSPQVSGLNRLINSENFCPYGSQEIWLFNASSQEKNPKFLNRFSKNPENVFWINNNYLIFNLENEIKIIETDDRDYLNIFTIKTFNSPKIFFSQFNKKLYVLSQGTLYSSEKLIP